jgi:hypothetical protein
MSTQYPYTVDQLEAGPSGDIYVLGEYGAENFATMGTGPFATGYGIVHIGVDGTIVSGHPASSGGVVAGTTGGYAFADWFTSTYNGFPGASATCPAGQRCTLLMGASPDHAVRWTRAVPGSASATAVITDMERVGSGDQVVAVGTVAGAFDFGTGSLPSDGSTDGFLWSFHDTDGSTVSAARLVGEPQQVHALADGSFVVEAFYLNAPTVGGVTLPYSGGVLSYDYVARYTSAGVASAVRSFVVASALDGDPIGADGALVAVGDRAPTLVDLDDANGASVASFTGTLATTPAGLVAAGSDVVLVGTGDGSMIGTLAVGSHAVYLARIDGMSAALHDVVAFGANGPPRVIPYSANEIVVAVVSGNMTFGATRLAAPAGTLGTFVARIRVR